MPTMMAALTAVSAEVFCTALGARCEPIVTLVDGSFLPGCASPVLSAVSLSFSTTPEVSSMSSLEFRSAVLLISVLASWSVYENANAPASCTAALSAPVGWVALAAPASLVKMVSNAVSPYLKPPSSSFFLPLTSSAAKPAVADAVSVALSSVPMPKVRKVESRICVARSSKPVAPGLTAPMSMRATPPRVSFSSAPSRSTCWSTSRWSPIRLNWSTPTMV